MASPCGSACPARRKQFPAAALLCHLSLYFAAQASASAMQACAWVNVTSPRHTSLCIRTSETVLSLRAVLTLPRLRGKI